MRYSQSKGLLKGVYILFMLKGGEMLRGVAGVSRPVSPEAPAGLLDENGYHSLGARKSLILGADLTSLNAHYSQLDLSTG